MSLLILSEEKAISKRYMQGGIVTEENTESVSRYDEIQQRNAISNRSLILYKLRYIGIGILFASIILMSIVYWYRGNTERSITHENENELKDLRAELKKMEQDYATLRQNYYDMEVEMVNLTEDAI